MLSFSPSGWPLEGSTSQEQESYMHRDAYTCYSPPLVHFPFLSPPTPSPLAEQAFDPLGIPFGVVKDEEATMVKKLNHNASERDRRKKMNSLYSTLRSLLPAADQMKKLSVPTTVSRALKHIPELQQQVEKLTQEKEKLLSRINASRDGDYYTSHQEISTGEGALQILVPSISATRLSESEVAIQISTRKVMTHKTVDFSEVLLALDYLGFPVISSSTFESCGGMKTTFYNLHVQVERSRGVECGDLKEKLSALFDHRKRSHVNFLGNFGNQIM
ncbi:transcription factor ORG2-like [Eucalyptus grandis]|uniref:transcription factor ORG2-like n=1 Tax=Eucalyptus grandis TaxID=71139 RepID=UPI00192E994C|nr:transcription factor ORG2-like [Eucalyptus grandis]